MKKDQTGMFGKHEAIVFLNVLNRPLSETPLTYPILCIFAYACKEVSTFMKRNYLFKRNMLKVYFRTALNLGCPCDLFWPQEVSGTDSISVPSPDLSGPACPLSQNPAPAMEMNPGWPAGK